MEESEKELLESIKNIDIKKLFMNKTYVEFQLNDSFSQAFIYDTKGNDKYILLIQNMKGIHDIPSNMLNFFSENDYPDDNKMRDNLLNIELNEMETEELISQVNKKLKQFNIKLNSKKNNSSKKGYNNTSSSTTISSNKTQNNNNIISDKNGKMVDVTGYFLFQFLCGYILDCLCIINGELLKRNLDNSQKNLFVNILDIIIYMGDVVKSNLKKYKIAYYNRRLLIVSQIHAILIGFDSLLYNIIFDFQFNYSVFPDLENRLTEISNIVYQIIINSKEGNYIPLPSLIIFIKFIIFDNVKDRIIKYEKKTVYQILNEHLKNLNENELKSYKKNSDMRRLCFELVYSLFENSNMNTLVNQSYYSFLYSCLKCKNLEKKMNALNDISDIINELDEKNKIDTTFKNFIEKNNVLDIIFEESIHDEIIKRTTNLFKYFAKYNCLSDNIIEKIIERQENNELMKKLLIEIISQLPKQKKDILYQRLSKGIKLDNSNNIEYISKLTESCFNISINDDVKNSKDKDKNYYGLNILFENLIKYNNNDQKQFDEKNVDMSIDSFEHIISKIMIHDRFDIDDAFIYIDKLFDNIKNNNNHNSVIQSIKLIRKFLNIIRDKKDIENMIKNLKILDEKYDIITLFVNDLIRYMKLLPSDYSNEKCKNKIYEGIYPHNINIEERLKIIFYFFKKSLNNFGLTIKGKKHIEKICQIFKFDKYKEEQKKFYEIFSRNIDEIDDLILEEFFKDILQNKNEFNLKEINDNETINLIIEIFKKVNENKKSLFYDGRNIRIEAGAQIEGFDMLFDLLTQNSDKNVQNKISKLLCDVCLSFKDYNNPKISDYWKMYFKKIIVYLDNISKSHDKIAFNGIIKLLNKIYSSSCNCYGKIPTKEDYKTNQEQSKLYHFIRPSTKRDYKIKAGINDRIFEMRWKLGYYYDIPVNNIVIIDLQGKKYTLNNDFEKFTQVFSNEKYSQERGFAFIKVEEEPFQLLKMKDNPKSLIENNENIYNILIDNLKVDIPNNKDIKDMDIETENKQKIWNIVSELPKNYYFENKLKKYGNKEEIKNNDLLELFDNKEIYLLTYSLQCLYHFLFNKTNEKDKQINQIIPDKKEYLNNFIGLYHGDKLIFDKLLNINIDKDNIKPIQIQCLTQIIDVLNEIEKYKENEKEIKFENIFENKDLYNNTLKKLTEIISSLLELNYIKYNNCINQINDDSNEPMKEKKNIYEEIAKLIEHIFNFIEEISVDKLAYINYLFDKNEIFTKVFVYDYIKCENDESRKKLDEFLTKNYAKNNDYIKKYFEIILTVDIFNYLVKNDKAGKYFHVISSIMKKYYEDKKNNNNSENKDISSPATTPNPIESKYIQQSKQIIDKILDYIQKECEKKEEIIENLNEKEEKILMKNKENFKEGILLFLANILNLNPKELVKYIINKIDVCDLFLNKCIMRKCIDKPLEAKNPFCLTIQSQRPVYKLLQIILENIQNNDLYLKIINFLNKYHHSGFFKTYNVKNWELESKEMQKGKYVGLKNMTATCYLNSIIQQLFMIPMFRETILKINNPSKNNVLYELQLLFSALKIYEFAYYDPRSFVIINKCDFYEQMDAEEFYGTLIDKIENDIKKIYLKTPTPEDSQTPKDTKNETYKYKDLFNYFFGIKVLDELKFVDCGHKRHNEFFYNSIQLEIKEFNNIHDSLKNYFKTEIMDGDNKINCEQCKIKRTCHKHLIFKSLPNILVIALKRFEFDYNTMLKYKLNKYFEFPYKLDMKDYLIEDHKETNTEYELTGITIHYGVADFGHYYDLIKGPDNKWYKFNDISVSEFKEEDIPREAFGEKELIDEDSNKEKESGKNNAYILIYKKKNFGDKIDNIDKKIKSDLALPPYSKYSNITDEIRNEINFKLFKSWTLKNIVSTAYQNFIFQLMKIDLVKIVDSNIEKNHFQLIKFLRTNEGLNIDTSKNNNNNNPETKNNKIFEYLIRYYFNILLRISKRQDKTTTLNYFSIFRGIIEIYIDSDINKAKYIIEEFSNTEAINEYITYCPNVECVKETLDIILHAFNFVYKKSINTNDTFIYEFMNTLIIYIDSKIRQINIEGVNYLLVEVISKGGNRFTNYLIKKNFEKWVSSFYVNRPQKNYPKNIINENSYPVIHSNHSILIENLYKNNKDKKDMFDENDISDQHFLNKLKDANANKTLIENLGQYFL